jgi:hypothetical protein
METDHKEVTESATVTAPTSADNRKEEGNDDHTIIEDLQRDQRNIASQVTRTAFDSDSLTIF